MGAALTNLLKVGIIQGADHPVSRDLRQPGPTENSTSLIRTSISWGHPWGEAGGKEKRRAAIKTAPENRPGFAPPRDDGINVESKPKFLRGGNAPVFALSRAL